MIDIAATFIRHAQTEELRAPLGIAYREGSAVELPFADASFDFATAFMSLMDIPETEWVLAEAFRVLRPGGVLQFSMTHPCFNPPHHKNCRDEDRVTYAVEVGAILSMRGAAWTSGFSAPRPSRCDGSCRSSRCRGFIAPISEWLNVLVAAGFVWEKFAEPCLSAETVRAHPMLQDAAVATYFLQIRARRPV